MSDFPTPPAKVQESEEFRRGNYRVYDENGFLASFAVAAPSNATLDGVLDGLRERFRGVLGTGYESKDMVVLLGPRIVAVVREGPDGDAEVTRFVD